jgi:hypothetical protein
MPRSTAIMATATSDVSPPLKLAGPPPPPPELALGAALGADIYVQISNIVFKLLKNGRMQEYLDL